MPHVVVQYTANLEQALDMPALCREIAQVLISQLDEDGKPLFPPGGTRVLAYPAQAYAVADGRGDYGFCYINIRIAGGRSAAMQQRSGDAVLQQVQARFAQAFETRRIGVTIHIDDSPGQVYEARHNNLNELFNR
jgi:5-carboxymethyl-2-hydroxymuconate isomerase